ncbi:MAG TPA: PQQ-binding-like beta-propeller repeat protein [Myxococcaceae bacterium]|nr:PQQ-binding-like beta-propeller repeat protein [Myxococcaceae bacterium]
MRLRRLGVCALVAASSLMGCRAVPLTADPLNPRPVPSPELFRVDWWHSLVGQRRLLEHAPREPAAPTWDAERQQLITLTRDGRVRALDAAGEERWSRPTDNHFSAGAGISAKRIYLPGGNGVLEALDPTTGESLWTYDTGEELGTMPVEVDGVVLVASHSNSLFAVDAETGAWKWQYRRELPSGFTIRGVSTPTVRDGVIYVGFADGALSALRLADGVAVWERMLSTSLGPFIDVDTQPIFDHQGVLYAASVKDGIFALDPMTGRTLWHQDVPGVTGLLLRGEVLFATGSDGVRAMVAGDGSTLWSMRLSDVAAGQPILSAGYLVAPVSDGLLFLDPGLGRTVLRWDPGQGVSAKATQGPDRSLYVLSNLGFVYALDLLGGQG